MVASDTNDYIATVNIDATPHKNISESLWTKSIDLGTIGKSLKRKRV